MKLNGFVGKGSGKLGSSVFAISGGEQIVREYNPVVSNPQTDAQVEQRAKLKLMSQLAAALALALAFSKKGLVSARNQFISKNIGFTEWDDNEASVDMTLLQLTPSSTAMTPIVATRGDNDSVNVVLDASGAKDFDKVVYIAVMRDGKNKAVVIDSVVADPGAGNTFAATLAGGDEQLFIYAYGVRFTSASALAKFNEYFLNVGGDDALLVINKATSTSGANLTATTCTVLAGL